jgi:DNA-binding XRE family transcriptional regulator
MLNSSPFKVVRKNLGVSIKDLALALGVNFQTIIQAENGFIKKPLKYAQLLKEAGFIEDIETILEEHAEWVQNLQQEKLQALKLMKANEDK